MDWNDIQNFLSNIVFGILLIVMIAYWINLIFFRKVSLFSKVGWVCIVLANLILIFINIENDYTKFSIDTVS